MNQKKEIVIIGAGGHGKVAADIARKRGFERIRFLDDGPAAHAEGKVSEYRRYLDCAVFFVAIGSSRVRERIMNELRSQGAELVSLIHPNAVIADHVEIGCGTIIMAGAVVNPDTRIGDGVIINTCASVDHDCRMGDYVHVAVGAHICGTVEIGAHTWVGAGATVINNISVTGACMIGAGAVVVKDISVKGTYIGVPAKRVQ